MRSLHPWFTNDSGIWIAKPSEDPLEAGSIGVGINLALYARAVATEAPCEIQVNGLRFFVDQARDVCAKKLVHLLKPS
ncbi:MAG: hypothetical protein QXP97_06085 [Desulfurococcus sp.]|jgi:pantoate kinase|uniref:hypothetical protein n=1 Tax=Desulfurococcus sp. TaxID=51678 RepID=UPI0031615782